MAHRNDCDFKTLKEEMGIETAARLEKVLGEKAMSSFLWDCRMYGYNLRGLSNKEIAWTVLGDMHEAFAFFNQHIIIKEAETRAFNKYGSTTDDNFNKIMNSDEFKNYKDNLMLESEKQLAELKEKLEKEFNLYDEDGLSTFDKELKGYDDWNVYDDRMRDSNMWEQSLEIFRVRK